jgi:predicted dienelactone hydrolase
VATPTAPADDAEVADGVFPLVVFSHGLTASGPAYEGRIREWARAGYVVAAPTFPLSSGPGGVLGDYVHQPADVSFVIDELLDLPADDPLAGHLDAEAIGAAGHSLGAITTIGLAFNSCCADDRIDAAIEISGLGMPFGDGTWDMDRTPLLAIHGAKDRLVPVRGSDTLFADAPGPAAYLRFPEGDHTSFLITEGALVDDVVIAFLDLHLRGEEGALDDVPERVEDHGGATFEVKPAR